MLGYVPFRKTELDVKNEHEADNCWSKNVGSTKKFNHVSLCAGYGGIDLGLRGAIENLRTIAYSEIEAYAVANLVAKMEKGFLDPAPVWTDLTTFPWEEFRDRIHILSGGYPCQPFSNAGKRLGKDDERHLWPFIRKGIKTARPVFCFFENVEGHLSLGFREVQQSLRSMGYAVEAGIFTAEEVGAPHERERLFILGMLVEYTNKEGLERLREIGEIGRNVSETKFSESGFAMRSEWVESVRGTLRGFDGTSNRVDRLSLCGNGVVPATARKAFGYLCGKLMRACRGEHELVG